VRVGLPSTDDDAATALTDQGLVSAVYQPVVELAGGEVVGYEALARGPQGGELERPDALLSAARRAGLIEQVDWECRLAAVAGALEAGLDRGTTLFVNIEAESLGGEIDGPPLWEEAHERLDVAVELPAGALRSHPAELVHAAAACRERGWTVVLDDVGVDAGSLAVLPLVAPDAIKLDLRALGAAGRPRLAEIANAVWAEQERTGATLVAEGIETEQQLELARGVGATLGQGWLWGRPGPLPADAAARAKASGLSAQSRRPAPDGTPFELLSAQREPRPASAELLGRMSRHLERRARDFGRAAVVLASLSEASLFRGPLRARYRAIASEATLVAALAPGMPAQPAVGVHGVALADDDPLRREWCVAVVAPHFAAALVARGSDPASDGNGASADGRGELRHVLTYDRELAIGVARSLVARLA
jgi:EAL domain-containing protein (putative c-di-GMP-specific phosphodiesterase class I)